jgi:hypothetical protein
MPSPSIIHFVEKWELQVIFNRIAIAKRANMGELQWHFISSRPIRQSANPFEAGSKFERFSYGDDIGNTVAVAHWTRNPDGSIAYSGLPDPDCIRDDDVLFKHPEARATGRSDEPWCAST